MKDPVETLIETFQNACLAKLEDVQAEARKAIDATLAAAGEQIAAIEAARLDLSEALAAQKVAFSREIGERDAKILQLTANIDRLVDWQSPPASRPRVGNVDQSARIVILEKQVTELTAAALELAEKEEALQRALAAHGREIGRPSLAGLGRVTLLEKQVTEKDARISNLLTLLGERDSVLAANDHETLTDRVASLEAEIERYKEAVSNLETNAETEATDHEEQIAALQKEVKDLEEQLEEATVDPDALADSIHGFLRSERLLPANLDVPMSIVSAVYRDGLARAVGEELS